MNRVELAVNARVSRTILPGLHQIALPTPFPVGDVNVFLAEGSPLTLIDCGVRTDDSRLALDEALQSLGYKLSDIERLLITHHHTDHVGLACQVVLASKAEVWSHPQTVRWIEKPRDARISLRHFTDSLYREHGVPEDKIEHMAQVGRYLETLSGSTRVSMTIDEGELVELCGMRWQVYHTPGHAGDLICLYQPDKRILLSSDHLLRDVSSNPLIEAPERPNAERPRRLLDYCRELARVARLDVQVAYTGHGDPILDVRRLVDVRLEHTRQRAEKLLHLFNSQPRTLYELVGMMFPNLHEAQLFLGLSEVLGHLDILEQEGRITLQRYGGAVCWTPARVA